MELDNAQGLESAYKDAAVQHLRSASVAVPAHTSPVGWEHIAFSGDFLWGRAAEDAPQPRSLSVVWRTLHAMPSI